MAKCLEFRLKCLKYLILCINIIIVLLAIALIAQGLTIYAVYISFFLENHFFSTSSCLIAIGALMLFISLFGCFSILKESTCLVNVFGVILSVVLILEIATAVAAYSLRSQIYSMLDLHLRGTMNYYYQDEEVRDAFDLAQSQFHCCGVDSYLDWNDMPSPPYRGIEIDNFSVPNSCCARAIPTEDSNVFECTKIYEDGCLSRIFYLVYQNVPIVGAGALTIVFIQIIDIIFSFSLASVIRKAKNERERLRWETEERAIIGCTSTTPRLENDPAAVAAPVVYVPEQGQTNA